MEHLAARLAAIPGVEAVTLGGSRATNTAHEGSDWDFGLYVLAGELALSRVLTGDLPRPGFPQKLRETAPVAWLQLAAGALHFANVHAQRQDSVACMANLCQAVLAAGEGRLAAAGEWVLNEKGLAERAGLAGLQDRFTQSDRGLEALVSEVRDLLAVKDAVWRSE